MTDEAVFDRAAQLRVAAVTHLGLRDEERIAGLVTGAGYPDALDPIVDALAAVTGPVADVGAGLGAASAYLAVRGRCRVVAVEPESGAAGLAAELFPELVTVVGEAAALPLAAGRCGAITFLGALSLVPDLDPVLGETARVLRAHGRLGLTDLCLTGEATERTTDANVFRSVGSLVAALDDHGFDVDLVETMPASCETRWTAISARVEEAMEEQFGDHPVMVAWREDGAGLHDLIASGTLEVATILATRRVTEPR